MKRRIAILGSTGSIGTQALDVMNQHPEKFEAEVLTADKNWQLLAEQAKKFKPNCVVIANESFYPNLKEALKDYPIKVYAGADSLKHVVEYDSIDIVLTALVGYSGLIPTLNALEHHKMVALANKETLVAAGELVILTSRQNNAPIIPVDSEHSAIFQCLMGEQGNDIEKILLTASGGPFRGKDKNFLEKATKAQALKHPNWNMGAKVTIDSASLMNKGLETIEAMHLFGVPVEKIEVLIHPQSLIHSGVQFEDGSVKVQMGMPDMRLPIQYALGFPCRMKSNFPKIDFFTLNGLTFEKPDINNFPNLGIAMNAAKKGGNMPCVMNAANEIAVKKFLNDEIGFLQMSNLIEKTINKMPFIDSPTLDDIINSHNEATKIAEEIVL